MTICYFYSGYVYATVRLATAIINYRFKSRTDTSRVMNMDAHLVRRCYERALLMKQFSRTDTDQQKYQHFIESFFNRILAYRNERSWKLVPIDQCQDFLKFPKVINTQTASTPNNISYFSLSNYQPKSTLVFLNTTEFTEKNFDCQLLDDYSDLWSDIAGSYLMDGETYDCVRFKCPFNYQQTGFNSMSYRGFILYSKVFIGMKKKMT